MKDYAIIESKQRVLFEDQASLHHPVIANVKTPKEIEDIFDLISYHKGL